jgi:phosphoribosyl 1,2-cyclic phosphodiesterase
VFTSYQLLVEQYLKYCNLKTMNKEFKITFWGVRGTLPVPGKSTLKYGGNTSCVEVKAGGRHIIFDAGTGISELGKQTDIFHTDILLSHTHLDHIQGLPFYRPLHTPDSNVALWAGHLKPERTLEEIMGHIMMSPVFPLTLNDVQSQVEFNDFNAGETLVNSGLAAAGITVETFALNHPDRATAYRLSFNGKSVCYVTDVEHKIGEVDSNLINFLRGTDVFIYDSTYDDNDFEKYKGWGHSTWQQGVKIADAANVKTYVAFHHDPAATDELLDERAQKLARLRPNGQGLIAREGMVIDLG